MIRRIRCRRSPLQFGGEKHRVKTLKKTISARGGYHRQDESEQHHPVRRNYLVHPGLELLLVAFIDILIYLKLLLVFDLTGGMVVTTRWAEGE